MRALTNEVRSIAALGRALLLLLPIVLGGCDWNRSKFIPDNLVGVWRTNDPRYRGRSMDLGKDTAVISTGVEKPSVESVESVKVQPAGEETTYTIQCHTSQGARHLLTLRFSPRGDGELWFSHQQSIVWKRRPATDISPHRRQRVTLVPRPLYEIDCIQRDCARDW